MSLKAMTWAWAQDVPIATKAVLLALADHADDEGDCWPGAKGVAAKCRISHRTVRYHLAILRNKRLITSTPNKRPDGSQMSNSYHLPVNILTDPMQLMTSPHATDDIPPMQPVAYHESPSESSIESSKGVSPNGDTKKVLSKALEKSFALFWEAYPRKKAKGDAETAWGKLRPTDELCQTILQALTLQKQHSGWDDRKYIPYPSSWLNGRRWEDELLEGGNNGTTGGSVSKARPDSGAAARPARSTKFAKYGVRAIDLPELDGADREAAERWLADAKQRGEGRLSDDPRSPGAPWDG